MKLFILGYFSDLLRVCLNKNHGSYFFVLIFLIKVLNLTDRKFGGAYKRIGRKVVMTEKIFDHFITKDQYI